jgi:elongation factor Tu
MNHHVKAQIRFLCQEEGGYRGTPIYSGYRPTIGIAGYNNDAIVTLSGREYILPGEEAEIEIRFLRPDLVLPRLKPGTELTLQEGSRVVASGQILSVSE